MADIPASQDKQRAIADARETLQDSFADAEAHVALGDAYRAVGHFAAAIQEYKYAAVLADDAPSRVRLVEAHVTLARQPQMARSYLQAAAKKDESDPDVLYWQGWMAYHVDDDSERAEQLLNRALELEPDNPAALNVAGQVRSRRAYNFWVPIIAIIVFPLIYLVVRFMRKGRVPKVPES